MKLYAGLLAFIHGLSKYIEVCKKKFNTLFKQYKVDKMANNVLGEGCHECKFNDSIDLWWHQTSTVMKHASPCANDNDHNSSEDSKLSKIFNYCTFIIQFKNLH
jgi:hypothetical protein